MRGIFMTFADHGIGQWSVLKLKFLESYLRAYLLATKTADHKYYIDCFAGLPEYTLRTSGEKVAGSSVIALETPGNFDEYIFIELDDERIAQLNDLRKSYPSKNISVYKGDCNREIKNILPRINKRSPIFIFLDTDGINIEWKTIEYASQWKCELLINFPFYMSIKRQMPWDENKMQQASEKSITAFYGTDTWKRILYDQYKPQQQRNNELIHLYKNNLETLGFKYVLFSDTFTTNTGNKLYYLVFAGNHPVGAKIMKHVFFKQFNVQPSLFD